MAARRLFAQRAKSGFFRRAKSSGSRVRRRFRRRSSEGAVSPMARRPTRIRRYIRSRFRRPSKQGLVSKAINVVTLAIGLSDVISRFQEKNWTGDIHGSLNEISSDYSCGLLSGGFDLQRTTRAYGPIVGA